MNRNQPPPAASTPPGGTWTTPTASDNAPLSVMEMDGMPVIDLETFEAPGSLEGPSTRIAAMEDVQPTTLQHPPPPRPASVQLFMKDFYTPMPQSAGSGARVTPAAPSMAKATDKRITGSTVAPSGLQARPRLKRAREPDNDVTEDAPEPKRQTPHGILQSPSASLTASQPRAGPADMAIEMASTGSPQNEKWREQAPTPSLAVERGPRQQEMSPALAHVRPPSTTGGRGRGKPQPSNVTARSGGFHFSPVTSGKDSPSTMLTPSPLATGTSTGTPSMGAKAATGTSTGTPSMGAKAAAADMTPTLPPVPSKMSSTAPAALAKRNLDTDFASESDSQATEVMVREHAEEDHEEVNSQATEVDAPERELEDTGDDGGDVEDMDTTEPNTATAVVVAPAPAAARVAAVAARAPAFSPLPRQDGRYRLTETQIVQNYIRSDFLENVYGSPFQEYLNARPHVGQRPSSFTNEHHCIPCAGMPPDTIYFAEKDNSIVARYYDPRIGREMQSMMGGSDMMLFTTNAGATGFMIEASAIPENFTLTPMAGWRFFSRRPPTGYCGNNARVGSDSNPVMGALEFGQLPIIKVPPMGCNFHAQDGWRPGQIPDIPVLLAYQNDIYQTFKLQRLRAGLTVADLPPNASFFLVETGHYDRIMRNGGSKLTLPLANWAPKNQPDMAAVRALNPTLPIQTSDAPTLGLEFAFVAMPGSNIVFANRHSKIVSAVCPAQHKSSPLVAVNADVYLGPLGYEWDAGRTTLVDNQQYFVDLVLRLVGDRLPPPNPYYDVPGTIRVYHEQMRECLDHFNKEKPLQRLLESANARGMKVSPAAMAAAPIIQSRPSTWSKRGPGVRGHNSPERFDNNGGYTVNNIGSATVVEQMFHADNTLRDSVTMCGAISYNHRKPGLGLQQSPQALDLPLDDLPLVGTSYRTSEDHFEYHVERREDPDRPDKRTTPSGKVLSLKKREHKAMLPTLAEFVTYETAPCACCGRMPRSHLGERWGADCNNNAWGYIKSAHGQVLAMCWLCNGGKFKSSLGEVVGMAHAVVANWPELFIPGALRNMTEEGLRARFLQRRDADLAAAGIVLPRERQ